MGDRAGIWLRVSGSGQDEEGQLPQIKSWCDDHGYEIAKTYQLHGKSASKGQQQAAQDQVIADIIAGLISVLVVVRVDRIERRRDLRHIINFIGAVRDAHGRVEFCSQTYLNVEGPMADSQLANMAAMAAEEARLKRERSAEGRAMTLANGGAMNHPPIGYRSEGGKRNKRFVPTEDGRYVPVIFTMIADGSSLGQVSAWLATEGLTITGPGIAAMIRNSTYMGLVTAKSGALAGQITHRCEALVDASLWQRANRALEDRSRKQRGPTVKAPLGSVLRCSCGAVMYLTHRERGTSGMEYRCAAKPSCGRVKALALENAVERIAESSFLAPVIAMVLIPGSDHTAEIETVSFELGRLGLKGLSRQEEQAERERLWAEEDRLRALPVVPDEWEEQVDPIHLSYLLWWNEIPVSERGKWLRDNGFSVTANRTEVTVTTPWGMTITEQL